MSMVPIQLLLLTVFVVYILLTCTAHRNVCDFIIRFYSIILNSIKLIITYFTHPLTRTSFSLDPNIFRPLVSLIYKTHMLFSCKSLHAYVTDKLYYDSIIYVYIYIVLSCIIHYIFNLETASTHLSRQNLDSETNKHTQYKVKSCSKKHS
jgi:hypothetical protein